MIKEIGSEFHRMPFEAGSGITLPRPGSLVFSGRTAIAAVLEQLKGARTALLPSYCCESMVVPFKAAGIDVNFYNVDWDDCLKIGDNGTADLFLWCNYFGFRNEMPDFDGVIIEDITHSLLSDTQGHRHSDYLVASLRKWQPINCGGYCSVETDTVVPPEEFLHLKSAAMEMKMHYLENPTPEKKEQFLGMFAASNFWIEKNYSGLGIDPWSRDYLIHIDLEKQKAVRRQNAEILYEGLKGVVQFMFQIEEMDCPLFVPIILKNRDSIRAKMTQNGIYCPVHWPRHNGCKSNLFDTELSLVCDHRYGIEDMERTVTVLRSVI